MAKIYFTLLLCIIPLNTYAADTLILKDGSALTWHYTYDPVLGYCQQTASGSFCVSTSEVIGHTDADPNVVQDFRETLAHVGTRYSDNVLASIESNDERRAVQKLRNRIQTNLVTYAPRSPASYSVVGNSLYGTDGMTATRVGNTWYQSDGTSLTSIGNFTYGSDGSSYSHIGNFTYGNDGTTYNRVGNTVYSSDGSFCSRLGNFINCY